MSDKERAVQLLDYVPANMMGYVLAYLQGVTAAAEAEDDAFCEKLYQDYLASPDKGEFIPLEECKKEWGLS